MATSMAAVLAVLAHTGNRVVDDHGMPGVALSSTPIRVIAEAKDVPVCLFDTRNSVFSYNELYVGSDNLVHISTRSLGVVRTGSVSLEDDIARYNKDVTRKIHNIVRL